MCTAAPLAWFQLLELLVLFTSALGFRVRGLGFRGLGLGSVGLPA